MKPDRLLDIVRKQKKYSHQVKNRMSKASNEISHYAEYDYIIVNDNFEDSVNKIKSILTAEGLKRSRQNKVQDIINDLLDDL